MKKFLNFLKNNKLYVFFFLFIIGINLLAYVAERSQEAVEKAETVIQEDAPAAQPEPGARLEQKLMFDEEDIKARQDKLQALAADNPALYMFLGALNLLIFFVIFVGIILDVCFIVRWLRRRPISITLERRESPRWTVGDVVRVVLIFTFFGYMFMIVQSFVTKALPILNNENFHMVFNTAAMNVVAISVIFHFVVQKYGQSVKAIGFISGKVFTSVVYAAIGYMALIPVILAIMVVTFYVTKLVHYQPPVQPIVQVFMEEKETAVLLFSALFAAIFGPIAEEIFFRGFMYTAVRKKLGVLPAILVTSALFSFLHTHIVGFLPILALGMLLAYLYEKTGSLVPSIMVHVMHNIGMVMLVFLMRGLGVV